MTTYIAKFIAKHVLSTTKQHSIFIWRQESGEIDTQLLENKIKREAAMPFYRLENDNSREVEAEEISVTILKTMPFSG
ncbi:GTP-binding protein LepA [Pseudozobellia sp. WGM2]|uniref:GTP-binding protein LepA n=1 Tax=Pseudozobellia sp. WGM2 TaxID=2787625 RepID=UPI001AE0C80F|nr:GTP-binding protein LepA [Pseudozobellia sp. WGM2]